MPTKHPRIFLTLKADDLASLDQIAAKLGKPRPWVLRKALRELAIKHGVKVDSSPG